MKFSVTTVSLPEMDLVEQSAFLSRLGYDGIEFRVRRNPDDSKAQDKPNPWGYHKNDISPDNLVSRANEIRSVLADHNLALASLASYVPCTDLEEFKRVHEGAVAVGAPMMRVGAAAPYTGAEGENYSSIYGETVAGYANCVEHSKGSGVKLILEAHGGTIHTSASLAYRILSNFSPEDVGIIYDPNNMVKDGFENIALAIQMLGDYLAHCHIAGHRPYPGEKNENGTTQWLWERCSMAEGLYDFEEMFKRLKQANYKGFISIEDYRDDKSSEEKYSEAINYLKKIC